jgi:hypothetical protein
MNSSVSLLVSDQHTTPLAIQLKHSTGDFIMKVMVLVKATQDSETGVMPSEQLLTEMGQYNE